MRIMITNFISNSALDWVENYKSYKNHLYITQWTVLDYNVLDKINSDKSKKDFLKANEKYKGLAYLLEEVPSSIIYEDITGLLLSETYFGSFNLAYFKEHQKILGLNDFNLPPFDFKTVANTSKENYHNGIPNIWNFTPFLFSQNDFK